MNNDRPNLTCAELDALLQESIGEIKADIEAHEERVALQTIDDGKTTTERALEALQRPERFNSEHDVARRWLHDNAPNGHFFKREDQ